MDRNPLIDVIRGLAILLMVLDHVAAVYGFDPWVRDLTRPALPMFMVLAGFLGSGLVTSRYWDVVTVAVMTLPLLVYLQLVLVPILVVFALVYPLLRYSPGWLVIFASAGLLWAHNWPLQWGGYEPGYVLAFLAFGRLGALAGVQIPRLTWSLPGLALIGRYPLTVYALHVFVIFAAVTLGYK